MSEKTEDKETAPGEYDGPEEKTIVLKKPLRLSPNDQEPITEITVREPTADQMSKFLQESRAKDDVAGGALLIALNSGISKAHALKLGSRDFKEALEFITGFTPLGPQTGES